MDTDRVLRAQGVPAGWDMTRPFVALLSAVAALSFSFRYGLFLGQLGVFTALCLFAAALAAYARDPDLRRRHGEGGLAIARTMDWDTINSAVIRAYKHAIVKRERLARMIGR